MKILVTGGAGFIGSHLVDRLILSKHRVVVIDNLSSGKKENLNPSAKFYKLDIVDKKLKAVFAKEKPQIVYHLAAQKSVGWSIKNPLADARINIIGSLNLIDQATENKVGKFIFISTGGAIYGETDILPTPETAWPRPASPYGIAKFSLEQYLDFYAKVKNLKVAILRLSNVYGPRQDPDGEAGVIAIFINNLLKNKECKINGNGRQTRDFIFVDDVVSASIQAQSKTGVYNIGTAKETSIINLYKIIAKNLDIKKLPKFNPAIKGEVERSVLNINKAKKNLSWSPKKPLTKGIGETSHWFKK
jgi:UDP-glucose 4-epimerase